MNSPTTHNGSEDLRTSQNLESRFSFIPHDVGFHVRLTLPHNVGLNVRLTLPHNVGLSVGLTLPHNAAKLIFSYKIPHNDGTFFDTNSNN